MGPVAGADRAVPSISKYPRHRELISINKLRTGHEADLPERTAEYNLRHDWNSLINDEAVGGKGIFFGNFSQDYLPKADALVKYLEHFASEYALKVEYSQTTAHITRKADGRLSLTTHTGREYLCKNVVVATGQYTSNAHHTVLSSDILTVCL